MITFWEKGFKKVAEMHGYPPESKTVMLNGVKYVIEGIEGCGLDWTIYVKVYGDDNPCDKGDLARREREAYFRGGIFG